MGLFSRLVSLATASLWLPVVLSAQRQPFNVEALLSLRQISEHQVSPDGTKVAFTVQTPDLTANTKPRQIYVVPLQIGEPRRITNLGNTSYRPRWSPDSKRIAFISDRSGSSQVWIMDSDGANARQVTTLATEADGVLFSPDGNWLVFTSEVYPDCPDAACNQKRLEAEKASKTQVRSYTSLMYRHWNTWRGARRKHLFAVTVAGGTPRDLTPGSIEAPAYQLTGPEDYAIAPDGREVMFTMNTDAEAALSTNRDLYVVPLGDALGTETPAPRKVTDNPGDDASPVYSPDGRLVAYRSQRRPGLESDRWRLMVLDRTSGRSTSLTDNLDRWIESLSFAPDSRRILFTMEDRGRANIHMIATTGGASRAMVTGAATMSDPVLTSDGKTMVYAQADASHPVELFRAESAGTPVALTHLNDAALPLFGLRKAEELSTEAEDRARIESFVVKPPNFVEGQKYPVLMLIHGGPQGSWGEAWSNRWNPQVFAAAGFVVVMPNPRGSTGYGQTFIDAVSMDWGGRAYSDLMAVADNIEKQPWADPKRMAAAGASYGGYMANWLLGHTSRFRAIVSHAGIYDLPSWAMETEELFFPVAEFGALPNQSSSQYELWSPSRSAITFQTPTLVTHGELDFRVPFGQGLQLFTALQTKKVPSKLMLFPDEGHWILKPQNSALWYRAVTDWLSEWTRALP